MHAHNANISKWNHTSSIRACVYLALFLPLFLERGGARACGADTLVRDEVGHLHVIRAI